MKRILYTIICCLLLFATLSLNAQSVIKGQVSYHDNWSMHSCKVYLKNAATLLTVDSTLTDSLGFYIFSQVPAGQYILDVKTGLNGGWVDLMDALLVFQYLAPGQNINFSSIQKKAADMNEDGQITHSDALAIISKWLAQNKFKNGEEGDWVFATNVQSDTLSNSGLPGDTLDVIITSSHTGDTDGNQVPQKKPSAFRYVTTAGSMQPQQLDDQILEVPIRVAESFAGTAIGLGFNLNGTTADFLSFEPGMASWQSNISGHSIRLSWVSSDGLPQYFQAGEIIGVMRISLGAGQLNDLRILQDAATHVSGSDGMLLKGTLFSIPEVATENRPPILATNYPNPFTHSTHIPFTLTEAGKVSLRLLDLQGRDVANILDQDMEAGSHVVYFNRSQQAAGCYILELRHQGQSSSFRLTRQIMLAD